MLPTVRSSICFYNWFISADFWEVPFLKSMSSWAIWLIALLLLPLPRLIIGGTLVILLLVSSEGYVSLVYPSLSARGVEAVG